MEFSKLSKELQNAVEQAEDVAIGYVQENILFSPFVITQDKKVNKIMAGSLEEAIEIAQEEIESMDEETVILVYKDIISHKDGDLDVIVSHIYNVDEESGYSFGLAYKIENGYLKFANNRIYLGDVRNCLIF